jgi:erythromycin esterase
MSTAIQRDAAVVAREARRISTAVDYDGLIERASQAQLILIGEVSHGTQDFYQTRAALTQRLIDEYGFRARWYVRRIAQIAFACMSM